MENTVRKSFKNKIHKILLDPTELLQVLRSCITFALPQGGFSLQLLELKIICTINDESLKCSYIP